MPATAMTVQRADPVRGSRQARVKMSVEMRDITGELTQRWRKRGHRFGIGIALGYATFGQIGFEQRLHAAIGSVANPPARAMRSRLARSWSAAASTAWSTIPRAGRSTTSTQGLQLPGAGRRDRELARRGRQRGMCPPRRRSDEEVARAGATHSMSRTAARPKTSKTTLQNNRWGC